MTDDTYNHWRELGRVFLLNRRSKERAKLDLVNALEAARNDGTLANHEVNWGRGDFQEIADGILERAQELIDHDS